MELKLDAGKWRRRRGVGRLLAALGSDEGLTRYVGGAVRDELLGLPVSDIDLATRLLPDEVMDRLNQARIKAVPTGIDHGTVTAVSDGQAVEITSLRRDVSTDGRRATVAFTDDWKEDAARRDFTINALSADPGTGEIFDYFGGLADLEHRCVRFIGEPLERIAEDHLRILRYFRFHARFGGPAADPAALEACTRRANDLMALSRERVADELLKLLALQNPAPTLRMMLERGILAPVLPEIEESALARLDAVITCETEAGLEADAIRRLAALLPRDPAEAENVANRLRLSNRSRKRLACAADPSPAGEPRALAYRIGTASAVDRLLLEGRVDDARTIAQWVPPRLPVGGGSLIERGLNKGPVIARTLRKIEARWIEEGFPTDDLLERIIDDELRLARSS